MKYARWTGLATLLVPIGVVVYIETPLKTFGFWLMTVGLFAFVVGWLFSVDEERTSLRERKNDLDEREKAEKRRQDEHNEFIETLRQMSGRPTLLKHKVDRTIERNRICKEMNE